MRPIDTSPPPALMAPAHKRHRVVGDEALRTASAASASAARSQQPDRRGGERRALMAASAPAEVRASEWRETPCWVFSQ